MQHGARRRKTILSPPRPASRNRPRLRNAAGRDCGSCDCFLFSQTRTLILTRERLGERLIYHRNAGNLGVPSRWRKNQQPAAAQETTGSRETDRKKGNMDEPSISVKSSAILFGA